MSRQPTPINILDDLMPLGNGAAAIRQALLWDYDQLGADADAVRQHAVEIKLSERRASDAIVDAGRHLIAVKGRLQHGQWEDWLSVEFKMSDRTARRMMAVAEQFDGKTDTVSVLGPSVLYLLAGDSVPEPAREAVIDLAKTGQTVTKAQAQTIIDQHKPPKPAATLSGAVLEERVRQEIMQHYMRPMNQGEALWAANDMRRAARVKEGKFWRRVCVMPTTVDEIADCVLRLADEVTIGFDRWLPKSAGQPLMQVFAADEERQIEAGIAAMDEAERQALAASDLQVMQPAPAMGGLENLGTEIGAALAMAALSPDTETAVIRTREYLAAHGINGAFVRTREAATGDPRLGKMRRLVSLYEMVANSFDEFGELTGRDTETLAAGREMRRLIGWLEREINLLEGREVEPLADRWMVEEAA